MTKATSTQDQVCSSFMKRLIEPAAVVSVMDLPQVRLLSTLLLIFIPLSSIATVLTLLDQNIKTERETKLLLYLLLIATLMLIVAFAVNKTKYYGFASTLVVGVVLGSVLASVGIQHEVTNLDFLAVGILFSSIFQSWRSTLFWLVAISIGIFLLSLSVQVITPSVIVERMYFVLTIGAMAMLYTAIQQRNMKQIEERSRKLAVSEVALRESRDELEHRVKKRTIELEDANVQLQTSVATLKQHTRDTVLLAEMGDLLQACTSTEEASRAIGHIIPQLFPDTSGGLFVYNASRINLDTVFTWDLPLTELNQRGIEPDKCWALRRGRPHREEGLCTAVPCQDLPKPEQILCIPMVAHGDTLGVLHLRADKSSGNSPKKARLINERLALTSAEQMALSLSNLNLRETLKHQSIRDPLTGLFNRRYLDETLERERLRAARARASLGVIMLDIDHFKNFNDTFGHEAGDTVLEELGILLKNQVRGSDIACRYGGEEFVIILPEAPLEIVIERAESIRSKVDKMSVQHLGQSLGSITVSIGVALFPLHATTSDALLRTADQALYRAKKAGRDQVVIAESD